MEKTRGEGVRQGANSSATRGFVRRQVAFALQNHDMAQFLTYVREGRNSHDAYMRVLSERGIRAEEDEVDENDNDDMDEDADGLDADGLDADEAGAWEQDDGMDED
jgi:hypothetical protein